MQAVQMFEACIFGLQENVRLRKVTVFVRRYILPTRSSFGCYAPDPLCRGRNSQPAFWNKFHAAALMVRKPYVQDVFSRKHHQCPFACTIPIRIPQQKTEEHTSE